MKRIAALFMVLIMLSAMIPVMAEETTAEPVWQGTGYSFNGTGGIKGNENIGISGNEPFTIAFKVTPGVNITNNDYGNGIIGWGTAGNNNVNFIYYNSKENAFEYGFYGNDGQTAGEYEPYNEYYIVMTFDGHLQRFYIDGEAVSQREVSGINITDTPVTIGTDPTEQGRHFTGDVNDVRIYNYAMKEEEVVKMAGIEKTEYLMPLASSSYNGLKITSPYWNAQVKKMIEDWIPHCIEELEAADYGLNAFVQAGRKLRGESYTKYAEGQLWTNAYVYNIIESIALAVMIDPDEDEELADAQEYLRQKLDEWIPIVLSAQEEDGYIHTLHTLYDKPRWTVRRNHEGYVMGYFIEAALAHYEMTGMTDTRMYDAAVKCADLWCDTIGPAPKQFWSDEHEGIEMTLVKLGRFKNENEEKGSGDKYIELAQFLCDARGGGAKVEQNHLSASEQSEAVGHAVRAAYLYTGMTEVAMEKENNAYYKAVRRIWDSVVNHKLYITGSIGTISGTEEFADNYVLPNVSYSESCASCGMVFWSERMNSAFHDAQYIDELERQLYNVVAGAVNLEGNAFYYENELDADHSRYSWHTCPCCVGNIPRVILNLNKWMYSTEEDHTLYINMIAGTETSVELGDNEIELIQDSNYPWEGYGRITVNPEKEEQFTIKLRVPEMEESKIYSFGETDKSYTLKINNEVINATEENGYVVIEREWKQNDVIELSFPMEIKVVRADERVEADRGRVALQRGPIVYNFEDVDNAADSLDSLVIDTTAPMSAQWREDLLGGVTIINANGTRKTTAGNEETELVAIPNYARLNRGGRSVVWIAEDESIATSDEAETVESDVVINSVGYVKVGENLYKNPDFSDNSGENLDQWFVGVNGSGNPSNSNYQRPKVYSDGTYENLTPLKDAGLTTGVYEPSTRGTFYFGKDSSKTYLVENVSGDWTKCAWNGTRSLLSFVPIKENTYYTFSFEAYTGSSQASIRYGAIDIDNYVPSFSENGSLNFTSSDKVDCKNNGQQNIGGWWKKHTLTFNSGEGADYFMFNAYWLQVPSYLCMTNFELYELKSTEPVLINYIDTEGNIVAADEAITEAGEEISGTFYCNGKLIRVSEAYVVTSEDILNGEINVEAEVVSEYAAIADTYAASDNNIHDNDKDNHIFVSSAGTDRAADTDSDGESTLQGSVTTLGTHRVGLISFKKPEAADGKAVFLNINIAGAHQYIGSSTIKIAAICMSGRIHENSVYNNRYYDFDKNKAIWSIGTYSGTGEGMLQFDVTEAIRNIDDEYITFTFHVPTAGCYIIDTESAERGAEHEGKAAYLSFADAKSVTIEGADRITKNGGLVEGEAVAITDDTYIKIYSDEAAAFTDGVKVYRANEFITPSESASLISAGLGVNVVQGAQVRFGGGVDENGKINEGNGLRFIGQVDRNETLVNVAGAEYGIKITAEECEVPVYIEAEKWQNEEEGIFTAAITNLAENNYNRMFTATPYVKVDGQEFSGDTTVTRSIYKVAVGLLKNGVTLADNGEENDSYKLSENKTLTDVLQAYTNQVGIRLSFSADGACTPRIEGDGSYSGDVFFDVECIDNNNGSYNISIMPLDEFEIPVEIASWWKDYVRINNNNSAVKGMITNDKINEDGSIEFVFTPVVQ